METFCSYLNKNIEEGMCYDLQMISGGYIKESALPELKINKQELYKHCSKCKYCSENI